MADFFENGGLFKTVVVLTLLFVLYKVHDISVHITSSSYSASTHRTVKAEESKRAQSVHHSSKWETDVVIVPAVYREWEKGPPGWVLMAKSLGISTFVYQRLDPGLPQYAYNKGVEGGVYLQFIVDHYHDLPKRMAFVHSSPNVHNADWLEWVRCSRANLTYSTLNHGFISSRTPQYWARQPHMEGQFRAMGITGISSWVDQCWRDVLRVLGQPQPPKQPITASFYCCFQVIVSREQILKRPLSDYVALHKIIAQPPDVCHQGELNITELTEPINPMEKEEPLQHGLHTAGGAMECLQHVIFGQPLLQEGYTPQKWCAMFHPKSECGWKSPCPD